MGQAPLLSRVDQTQTPAFKRWFGDSVVTKDGKPGGEPLVVYHGTRADFSSFYVPHPEGKQRFYFAADPNVATEYGNDATGRSGQGANLMPVFVSLKNPAVVEAGGANFTGVDLSGVPSALHSLLPPEVVRRGYASLSSIANAAEKQGHDGVVVQNVRDGAGPYGEQNPGDVFIAFRPEQIKSAIGNQGTFDPNSPSILLSRQPKTEEGWAMPTDSWLDKKLWKFQDKQIDLKRAIGAIKQEAIDVAENIDAYLQEELFHGRSAKRTQDFIRDELEPLLKDMALKGVKTEELEKFLHARHAREANELIAERNKLPNEGQLDIDGKPIVSPLQDGGSGMLTQDAQDYLKALTPERRKLLDTLAARVDTIIETTRAYQVAYGLVSEAQSDAWAEMFDHYVPLFREDEGALTRGLGTGQGFSIKGKESQSRTGSTAKVVDILANIAMARERAIVRGEKNRVAVALAGLAKANPNDDIWTFGPVKERRYNEATGTVEVQIKGNWKNADNVLVAKVRTSKGDIQEVGVVFNENNERAMRMALALKNLDAAKLEEWQATAATITRYFAAINTQYNPIFGIVNLMRDVQGAALNLGSTPLKDKRLEVMSHIGPALKTVLQKEAGGTPSNKEMAALWEEMQLEGGMTGFRDLYRSSDERAKSIEFALNPTAWMDGKMGKFFTAGGTLKVPAAALQLGAAKVFRGLSHYNTAMEAATRLAAYKTAIDAGLSKQQAASIAKNLTVNFNRKGQVGQQMGAFYAFFNAAVQGTARMAEVMFTSENGQNIRLSKTGLKIVAGGMLLGSLQAFALALAGYDDEEPPQFVRERNLIIPLGLVSGKKNYLTIPMPLGWHVLPNIGRIFTELALSGFKSPGKRALDLASVVADAFNPIGNAGMSWQTLTPTVADPIVALLENKDWTGRPIYRKSFNANQPGFKNAKDTASTPGKMAAEAINWVTGGTRHTRGYFSPTPDQIDYLLGQVTGGVGRELGKVNQSVSAGITGEELAPHKIPLLGRLYGDVQSSSGQAGRFYETINRIAVHKEMLKGLDNDYREARSETDKAELLKELNAYKAANPELDLAKDAQKSIKHVRKLLAEKRDLLKRSAPRAEVKRVEAKITEEMRLFNETAKSWLERQQPASKPAQRIPETEQG